MLPDPERNRNASLDAEEALDGPSSYKYLVLTLPNEIVSESSFALSPLNLLAHHGSGAFRRRVTLLSQICRQWQSIAFATPQLL
ncbi:hypothetical protein R3P38DRAFT_3073922 [Favolaschia claudopus]|uniref:F-box domain-containing protein n=1 Tax=Favolaschia claudopus TaxID=2862362 RepID=A0AAV9ZZ67_9AGAR